MPTVGFEPSIPTSELPQTHPFDCTATVIGTRLIGKQYINVETGQNYETNYVICTKRQTRRINDNAEDGWKNKRINKVKQTVSYIAAERGKKWHNSLTVR
jgi:hypothetical protein